MCGCWCHLTLLCGGEVGDKEPLLTAEKCLWESLHGCWCQVSGWPCQVVAPSKTRVQELLTLPSSLQRDLFLRSHNARGALTKSSTNSRRVSHPFWPMCLLIPSPEPAKKPQRKGKLHTGFLQSPHSLWSCHLSGGWVSFPSSYQVPSALVILCRNHTFKLWASILNLESSLNGPISTDSTWSSFMFFHVIPHP